jgi:hypothetical protein
MMNVQEESKNSRIDNVTLALKEVEDLSYKVLAQMKDKKESYFGQRPEKAEGHNGIPTTDKDNGIIDKMNTNLIRIKQNLTEISQIINLF